VSDLVSFFVTDGVISAKNVDSRDDGASESVFKTNDQCQRYVITGCAVFSSVSSIRWQDSKVDGYFDLSTIDLEREATLPKFLHQLCGTRYSRWKMALDDDVIRIMIHTDSHLGFKERDPVRGDDSFAAFEEALKQAKNLHADMVLHAGDMFHENKPTRRTMHQTMKIFRDHCLGEDPVYITCTNEQKEVFKNNDGHVNYEDPYSCVSLPYFAIHGNHDDPSREGTGGEALAALDLLAVSNLINYYGKSERVDDIEIHPVLINKNGTKLALYGLGAVRDERLNRMWRNKKVRFVRPRDVEGEEKWFNILVLHQNRDYGRGTKNCIHESMIPQWVNVVIWGNEHECQPELAETLVGTFRIYQPGSSVATSLVKTESAEFPKKFGVLEIRGIKFRLKTYPFTQVRPFLFGEIKLQEIPQLDPQDPNVQEKVATVLQKRIQNMIDEGREMSRAVEAGAHTLQLANRVKDPSLILLRLRVEYEGFVSLNQQRFGALFVGKVANPSELLLFSKSKKYGGGKSGTTGAASAKRLPAFLQGGDAEDGDDASKISLDELVFESLNRNSSLNILPSTEMETAINAFVVKKNPNAIMDAVQHALEVAQDSIWKDKGAPSTRDAISSAAAILKSNVEGKSGSGKPSAKSAAIAELLASKPGSTAPGSDDDSVKAPAKRGRAGASKPAAAAAAKKSAKGKRALSPEMDTESQNENDSIQDSEEDLAPKRKGAIAAKATKAKAPPARPSRAKAKKSYVDEFNSDNDGGGDDYADDVDAVEMSDGEDEEEEEEAEKPKGRGRAAPKKAVKKPAAKKAATPVKRAPAKKRQIDEESDVMDLVSSDEEVKPKPRARVDVDVSQVKLTAGYTPGNGSILNDQGVGSGMSISASGLTAPARKRALPGALSQRSVANQDWD